MISKEEMLDLILKASPCFKKKYEEVIEKNSRAYVDRHGELQGYIVLGDFARHLIESFTHSELTEFPVIFDVVERLHLHGDGYVREAATIGLLESIQNCCSAYQPNGQEAKHLSDPRLDPSVFIPFLGPESKRCWHDLNGFGDNKVPQK